MSDKLPAPLTPANCDLRDFDGFLMNVERLLASELWALSTPEEFKCAMALWCRAWKQVPCASLPDDDKVLAAFSGAGRRWQKVKRLALRGFVKCSDGRLYHATLSQDALRAMKAKAENKARTEKATEARRKSTRNVDRDDNRDVDRDVDRNDLHKGNVTRSQYSTVHRREDKKEESSTAGASEVPKPEASAPSQQPLDRLAKILGLDHKAIYRLPKFASFPGTYREWVSSGCDPARDIWPTIEKLAKRSKNISSPRFFEAAVQEARDLRLASQPSPFETWAPRIEGYREFGRWDRKHWGPPPDEAGCRAPAELISQAETEQRA